MKKSQFSSLWLLVLSMLMASYTNAIPLLGPEFKVELTVIDSAELQKTLEGFIKDQQKSNVQLKAVIDAKDDASDKAQTVDRYGKLLSEVVRKKLNALGYYNFSLNLSHNEKTIFLRLKPGKIAKIEAIVVKQPDFIEEDLTTVVIDEQFQVGDPLLAEAVLDAQSRLKRHIDQKYCFVSPQLKQKVGLVRSTQAARVTFTLETKPEQAIAAIDFKGTDSLSNEFLGNIISLKPGCYKASRVQQAQVDLLQTGLLSSAVPKIEQLPNNKVNLTFNVQERKHRTQRVGLGFSTDEGPRLTLGWENRNWRGNGKNLSTELRVSKITTQLTGELRVPQFKTPKLALLLQGEVFKTSVDAFDVSGARASSLLEYQANRHWLFSTGLTSRYNKVESSTGEDIFRLISIPNTVQWDRSDDLLDPTKGFTWIFSVEPFTDMVSPEIQFTQFVTGLRHYYSPKWAFNEDGLKRLTIATRIATGSIRGEPLQSVPADQRYYTGGGGSVRGFDYQSLAPRQADIGEDADIAPDAIVGGLSFFEVAGELRMRFTEQWGAGLFVDAGRGFVDSSPDFSAPLGIGGGLGLRYMTSFAPIRIDLAWPIDSPSNIDNGLQLYVGLKQAF